MKIGAYQFDTTNDINENLEIIKKAVVQAINNNVKLLVFPECALTGYPPRDIESPADINFDNLERAYELLFNLANVNDIYLIVGTITKEKDNYYNSAILFTPKREKIVYNKRALWGWDKDNFSLGDGIGIVDIEGFKIGIRICFEIRFPEFFRELYKQCTDLNIVLFYDVADNDDMARYELIKSHIVTRAVENVTHILSVNTIKPYQTAPTALFDKSGSVLSELIRNEEGLLVYDLEKKESIFGEQGREQISDWLLGIHKG